MLFASSVAHTITFIAAFPSAVSSATNVASTESIVASLSALSAFAPATGE